MCLLSLLVSFIHQVITCPYVLFLQSAILLTLFLSGAINLPCPLWPFSILTGASLELSANSLLFTHPQLCYIGVSSFSSEHAFCWECWDCFSLWIIYADQTKRESWGQATLGKHTCVVGFFSFMQLYFHWLNCDITSTEEEWSATIFAASFFWP